MARKAQTRIYEEPYYLGLSALIHQPSLALG